MALPTTNLQQLNTFMNDRPIGDPMYLWTEHPCRPVGLGGWGPYADSF